MSETKKHTFCFCFTFKLIKVNYPFASKQDKVFQALSVLLSKLRELKETKDRLERDLRDIPEQDLRERWRLRDLNSTLSWTDRQTDGWTDKVTP